MMQRYHQNNINQLSKQEEHQKVMGKARFAVEIKQQTNNKQ